MSNDVFSPAKIKLHIHSDCDFFAGCENMVANLLNSNEFNKSFGITFSFRTSKKYVQGFLRRVPDPPQIFSLNILDLNQLNLGYLIPNFIERIVGRILIYPLFFYEVIIFYLLFRKSKPQILHINNGGYPGALSCRAAAVAGKIALVPHVVMVVNNLAVNYSSCGRKYEFLIDFFVKRAVNFFITASFFARERVQKVLKLDSKSVVNIHNGIDLRHLTEALHETRKRLGLDEYCGVVIGVVAILEKRKGHLVLFNAINLLVRQNPGLQIKLLVEGEGEISDELRKFVSNKKLDDWIKFVGAESNVMNFINALDIFVLPSIYDEDFPNVILEAMSLGKPVVSTLLAGIPEQVANGESGMLVDVNNPYLLRDAIFKMSTDVLVRKNMGAKGLAIFKEKFISRVAVNHYQQFYKNLTKKDKC